MAHLYSGVLLISPLDFKFHNILHLLLQPATSLKLTQKIFVYTQPIPIMPFFSRQPEPEPEPQYEEPPRKHGLLGSLRRDHSPTPTTSTQASNHTASTYRTSQSSASTLNSHKPSRGGSLLHKLRGGSDEELDPSIVQARERVMGAEAAERDADKALELARREVREAREEVKRIEIEAKEEARRAKIKAFHAKDIGKRGKALGRELTHRAVLDVCTFANNFLQATTFRSSEGTSLSLGQTIGTGYILRACGNMPIASAFPYVLKRELGETIYQYHLSITSELFLNTHTISDPLTRSNISSSTQVQAGTH